MKIKKLAEWLQTQDQDAEVVFINDMLQFEEVNETYSFNDPSETSFLLRTLRNRLNTSRPEFTDKNVVVLG